VTVFGDLAPTGGLPTLRSPGTVGAAAGRGGVAADEDDGWSVDEWGAGLAKRATPDEIELVPEMVAAWLAGGWRRRDLLRPPLPGDPGWSRSGAPARDFPAVLQALAHAAAAMPALLDGDSLFAVLATADQPVDLGWGPSSALPVEDAIGRLTARLAAELLAADVDPRRAATVAHEVVAALRDDPLGGARFVSRLATESAG
jgi:hypothetical protein